MGSIEADEGFGTEKTYGSGMTAGTLKLTQLGSLDSGLVTGSGSYMMVTKHGFRAGYFYDPLSDGAHNRILITKNSCSITVKGHKLVLSDANMLNKLSPFFVIIFSALFLKEKINIKQGLAIIIAFIGALFIIKPQFNFDIIPSLIGVCGSICAAAAYTCLRALGGKEKYYTIVFYFSFFSTIAILPFMLMVYKEMSMLQFVYLILAGIFASIGQFGITIAYKYAKAKEISIFDYSNILFSAIISIVLFGVIPDYLSVIGYIIIFAVSLYMFLYNKKLDSSISFAYFLAILWIDSNVLCPSSPNSNT